VPQDLGQFVGNPAFEMARGVLMEVYRCSAAQAMVMLREQVARTDMDAAVLVARILADHTGPGVADLLGRQLPPRT
jgi:hypothetical protein